MKRIAIYLILLILMVGVGVGSTVAMGTPTPAPGQSASDALPVDVTLLEQGLKIIAYLGGSAGIAYYLMKPIGKQMAQSGANDFAIRVISYAITGGLAIGAYILLQVLTYRPLPVDWREWLMVLTAITFTSWGVNQFIHGFAQKRNEHGGLT